MFGLPYRMVEEWSELQSNLVSVANLCLEQHPLAVLPRVHPPRLPFSYGYSHEYETRASALTAVTRAREAFKILSAFVTFALSLWITQYSDDCFEEAWHMLATHPVKPFPRLWLEDLQDSTICDLSGGIRPGGFLDPHATRWGPVVHRITRASVPIWFLWGPDDFRKPLLDKGMAIYYYPPARTIEEAKRNKIIYSKIVLPHAVLPHEQTYAGPEQLDSPFPDIPIPDPVPPPPTPTLPTSTIPWDDVASATEPPLPNPCVDRSQIVNKFCRQRPGETWRDFFARMEADEEKRKSVEKPAERQRRESIKKIADKGILTKKATVFEWEQDTEDPTVYRRRRIDKSSAEDYFDDYDRTQRRFWSHLNEWDLCPELPRDTDGAETCPFSGLPLTECEDSASAADADVTSVPAEYAFVFPSIFDYLRLRHGFDAELRSWNPDVHATDKTSLLADNQVVFKRLLYAPAPHPPTSDSFVDFYNTTGNTNLSYKDLPSSWDISPRSPSPASICDNRRLALRIAYTPDGAKLYILFPPRDSKDDSRWFVATTSATTILFAYRKGWTTMLETGRGLLEHGIPFRTVLKVSLFLSISAIFNGTPL